MGRSPPNLVRSKSPTARSSILRSPSAVSIFVPLRKQLALQRAGGQANAAVLARTTDPKIAPILTMFRRVRRAVSPESSRSAVKIVVPLFHLNLRETIFAPLSTHFPKRKRPFLGERVYGCRPAAAPSRLDCANPPSQPVQPRATGGRRRRRRSTGGSSQRPLNVDSRPSIARREPALGVVPILAARWRPPYITYAVCL